MAILPGNILVLDPSTRWLAAGVPIVLQTDLATAAHLAAGSVESQSQAYQAQASEVLRTTLELQDHQWRASVAVIDLSSQLTNDVFVVTRPEAGGVIALLDAIAKHLDATASTFSTHQDKALQAYSAAASSPDPNARLQNLSAAVKTDPGFGLAYFSAVDTLAQSDPSAAGDWLRKASAAAPGFTPLDRARLNAISTRLTHAPLQVQADAAAQLAVLAPNNLDALVGLGSLRFLQGESRQGVQLLQKALQLSPGNATVRSYLALGLVESRQFRQAAAIFESLGNDPATLPQLAVCVLLAGDEPRANAIMERYLKIQEGGGNPTVPLIRANWLAISGKLRDAVALAKTAPLPSPDLHSLALSQAAVWELMEKDHIGARADAAAALRIASSVQVKSLAAAANAIAAGGPLRQNVDAAGLTAEQKAIVLAYGLFLNDQYADAAGAWKAISDQSGGADLRGRAMLAGSLDRAHAGTGRRSPPVEAFIPNVAAGDQYAAVAFNEMRRLLGR